jgi:Flp pilus assembly protein TadD
MALIPALAYAGDIHLKLPKRSKLTPVQQLNQAGVRALNHNDIAKARRDFYRAYLLDPDDPFTLNNMGYIAELDGEIDRAVKFYNLAAANGSNAVVALSSNRAMEGKLVSEISGNAANTPMQVKRLNVTAMGWMMKDRAPEAELVLRKALVLEPKNPFTLNNLAYVLEKEGELEEAVRLYSQAAASGSTEEVIIALNRSWRGRSISEVAALNADAARREVAAEQSVQARVARLNLRGVSALNRNQPAQARGYFQQAYRLDPGNAFSLNNMGYLAETEGDRESADYYYAKAREALGSTARVALSSRRSAEGMRLASVADGNRLSVENAEERQLAALRAEGAPPLPLRTRDRAFVREPATPPRPEPESPVRIVAVDNPPGESHPVASPTQPVRRPAASQPAAAQAAPATAPTTKPSPDDQRPLLPVIPDELPLR